MMKVITVLGARPQFIKAAMLSHSFKREPSIREIIIHTGQHYDKNMSDVFFDEMQIPRPDYFLNVTSKYHGEMTGKMLEGIEKILVDEKPDAVVVFGDTNSTLAGALAAAKLHIPIAHVEAGLRSFNKNMPEEINRIMTDHISEWLFVPSISATNNLRTEGLPSERIVEVGDIMFDAVLFYQKLAASHSSIIEDLKLSDTSYILATIHRAENTNDPERLTQIFDALEAVSKNIKVILPIHPRTKGLLRKQYDSENFRLIEPVGYFDMLMLQKNSTIIVTDSGGVQKEAYFNSKYCITLRDETEWTELLDEKVNFLCDANALVKQVESLWKMDFPTKTRQLYGDGTTASKIVNTLKVKFT